MMVAQLGFAMMPLCQATSAPLISGTTRGTSGSMRKAWLLSTTTAPAFTASGSSFLAMASSAAPSTKSQPSNASGRASWMVTVAPRNSTVLPALRALASRRNSPTGISCSSRHWSICVPTAPVAPKMAIVYCFMSSSRCARASSSRALRRLAVPCFAAMFRRCVCPVRRVYRAHVSI